MIFGAIVALEKGKTLGVHNISVMTQLLKR